MRANLQKIPPRSLGDMAADYVPFLPTMPRSRTDDAIQPAGIDRLVAQTRAAQLGDAQRLVEKVRSETRTHLDELHRRGEWAISLEWDLKHTQTVLNEQKAELDHQHAECDRLDGEFAERTRWALALDAQRETLQDELTTMRNSRSWRLTRPIRFAARKLRALRVRIGFILNRLRNAGTRTRGSLARRGLAGTVQRAAVELQRARGNIPNPTALYVPPEPAAKTPAARYAVPSAATPRVSIVIPVYNKFEYTDACLRSLAEHSGEVSFETIVVDDCSSDVTAERLSLISGIRVLRNTQNLGFIGSCNAGAQVAKGDFVLFLNNDTVVTLRAGSKRCCVASPKNPMRVLSARNWSIPMAVCRKPAASYSATVRAGTTGASKIRLTRATNSAVKPITARARRSCCRARCSTT